MGWGVGDLIILFACMIGVQAQMGLASLLSYASQTALSETIQAIII